MKKVLIVEDSISLAHTYETYLAKEPYESHMVYNGSDAMDALESHKPDAVLLDLNLPDMNGMDILHAIRDRKMRCAVLVITGQASINTAVEAMQGGADDFVGKPVNPDRLLISLKNALEKTELREIASTYETIKRSSFCDFVGQSPHMQTVYNIIENAAVSKASVFITGESGTGKELCARGIHQMSDRSDQPFEALNCAAIPHNLLESEIFGHVKGAFTGATSNREGAARRAHRGTLFLDELGEMPMALQSKLLRFIQTGTFTPVGAGKLEQVDVRFVCATNRNPLQAVQNGLLREDLYYRLNVIPITMPSLHERGSDIILLAEAFLERAASEENKEFQGFSEESKELLTQYNWPGNVRELENVIRSAVVLNNGDSITPEMLTLITSHRHHRTTSPTMTMNPAASINVHDPMVSAISGAGIEFNKETIRPFPDIERDIIEAAIRACDNNISDAARRLQINPSTIHRKMKNWVK